MGGSHGMISMDLATSFPNPKIVVKHLLEVVDKHGAEMCSRVNFMVHDFIAPQPQGCGRVLPAMDLP